MLRPRRTVAGLRNRILRALSVFLAVFAVKAVSLNRKDRQEDAKGAKIYHQRFPARRSCRNCASALETADRRRMCTSPPLPNTKAHTSHATKSAAAAIQTPKLLPPPASTSTRPC